MSVSMDEKPPGHGTNNFYHRISQTIRFLNLEQECGYHLSCEFLSFSTLHSSPSNSHRPRSTTAEWLHEKIITILKSIDTQNIFGKAEDMIGKFLGLDSTRILFHELRAWLRSWFETLAEWDGAVKRLSFEMDT